MHSPEKRAVFQRILRAAIIMTLSLSGLREGCAWQAGAPAEAKALTARRPLTDFTSGESYKGQTGGLYGDEKNEPPPAHFEAALRQARLIRPLDAKGTPADDGKIVLISIGMSNTTQEFSAFMRLVGRDPEKSPAVQLVDGAQGAMDAGAWARPERIARPNAANPWDVLDQRLMQAGVAAAQVQVAWLKQARAGPAMLGEFPKHADELKNDILIALHKLKERFPNLRIVYLSSRIYAGYAKSQLNPEPYAFESAFAVRGLILDQIAGEPALAYAGETGAAKSPLLLWGPYLWADGVRGRAAGDLVWNEEDLGQDGTHPSPSGQRKVAEQLLRFFKTDATAKTWFVKPSGAR